jgi:5S rRNA maturation endonuclease (ribonuclease M5)
MNNISIKDYLVIKGIEFIVSGNELIAKCFFSNCDSDSRPNERHLYFNSETSQYECKKCGAKGNIITLQKYFSDPVMNDFFSDEPKQKRSKKIISPEEVEKYHKAIPENILHYLYRRGLSPEIVEKYKLGYGVFYGKSWIVIPIKDVDGNYCYFKLRQDPDEGDRKMTWPKDVATAQIYDWDTLFTATEKDKILICEGELDTLTMKSSGLTAITNTHGANTAKDEWMQYFRPELNYYIAYDNDEAGRVGAKKMADKLFKNGCKNIFIVDFRKNEYCNGEKYDLTDFYQEALYYNFADWKDLFTELATPYPEKIETSQFKEISTEEVCEILNSTIKKDDENKMITFLSMLTTYTDEAQMNVFFNAPSSTGKSHLPLSVADFFPMTDKIILAQCSPTAFFHENGLYDKEKNEIIVDLSRKILIFTDMPNTGLLERLRSILSHDAKESRLKITDKNQKGGNRTKTVVIVGFPSVYFCSAGLRVDEQESTRFIMLSPSIEHEKIFQGIQQSISKESDREKFMKDLNDDPERNLLKERILGIKQEKINDVKIENTELIQKLFLQDSKSVKPRQQRDIKKIISLIKGFSLLNVWFRKRQDDYIWATENDIQDAFVLWNKISYGQDYGLAPYVFEIYTKIILPLWEEPSDRFGNLSSDTDRKHGITRKEILDRHFKIYGRPLSLVYLRQHILPQLEQVGLIMQERSMDDKREMVVIPLETKIEE